MYVVKGPSLVSSPADAQTLFFLLTDHLKKSFLTSHWIGVDLTHVPAAIVLFDGLQMEPPDFTVVVRKRDTLVAGDDVLVNCQNGLSVHAHPSNLKGEGIYVHFFSS